MEDARPSKSEILQIFRRLRASATNKVCFDCNAINPTWSSVTYGVFLCLDCSAVHRGLGVHVTFVRSTQLDTSWTWLQLRNMQIGGNANAISFFRTHNCTTTDAQIKYSSRAAQLYKDKLHNSSVAAMKLHGTKLHLEINPPESPSADKKEVDFFEENEDALTKEVVQNGNAQVIPRNDSKSNLCDENSRQPTVNIDGSNKPASATHKSTIGARKPGTKKVGKGLGAHKVKKDFSHVEKEVQLIDEQREQDVQDRKVQQEKEEEDNSRQLASMKLAYQDFDKQKDRETTKMKEKDPKKAEQLERLGMGFNASRTGISHSSSSNMLSIEQTNLPRENNYNNNSSNSGYKSRTRDNNEADRDFEIIDSDSFKGPPKYKDSPFDDKFSGFSIKDDEEDFFSSNSFSKTTSSKSSWDKTESKTTTSSSSWDKVESSKTSSWDAPESNSSWDRGARPGTLGVTTGDDAQKKFGAAKSISSNQMFNDVSDYERRSNLSRFENSSAISSSDYFGDGTTNRTSASTNSYGQGLTTPDLDDVKESVRSGVTKVAGKLSSMAGTVMNSIQRK